MTARQELQSLYHTARIPLGTAASRYDRMRWAVNEYLKAHPEDWRDKFSSRKALWFEMEEAIAYHRIGKCFP